MISNFNDRIITDSNHRAMKYHVYGPKNDIKCQTLKEDGLLKRFVYTTITGSRSHPGINNNEVDDFICDETFEMIYGYIDLTKAVRINTFRKKYLTSECIVYKCLLKETWEQFYSNLIDQQYNKNDICIFYGNDEDESSTLDLDKIEKIIAEKDEKELLKFLDDEGNDCQDPGPSPGPGLGSDNDNDNSGSIHLDEDEEKKICLDTDGDINMNIEPKPQPITTPAPVPYIPTTKDFMVMFTNICCFNPKMKNYARGSIPPGETIGEVARGYIEPNEEERLSAAETRQKEIQSIAASRFGYNICDHIQTYSRQYAQAFVYEKMLELGIPSSEFHKDNIVGDLYHDLLRLYRIEISNDFYANLESKLRRREEIKSLLETINIDDDNIDDDNIE
jgi:hypothetical protein